MRSPVRIWLSAPKRQHPIRGAVFLHLRLVFELATSNAKHFSIKPNGAAVQRCSPVRIWLSAPKRQHPIRGAVFLHLRLVFELATSNAKHFSIKPNGAAVQRCSPVRIWLSRRRKLHIACDDFLCFASKSHLALVPLLLLLKIKTARPLRALSTTSALRCAGF